MSSGTTITVYRLEGKPLEKEKLDALKTRLFADWKKIHSSSYSLERAKEINESYLPRFAYYELGTDNIVVSDYQPGSGENEPPKWLKLEPYKRIDLQTGKVATKILESDFMSNFTSLREDFGLNGYSSNESENYIVLDDGTAHAILCACNYLLNGKYDDKVAECFDNRFVNILGKDHLPYAWRKRQKDLDEVSEDEKNEMIYVYQQLKTVIDAYLMMKSNDEYGENKGEYILIYSAWG